MLQDDHVARARAGPHHLVAQVFWVPMSRNLITRYLPCRNNTYCTLDWFPASRSSRMQLQSLSHRRRPQCIRGSDLQLVRRYASPFSQDNRLGQAETSCQLPSWTDHETDTVDVEDLSPSLPRRLDWLRVLLDNSCLCWYQGASCFSAISSGGHLKHGTKLPKIVPNASRSLIGYYSSWHCGLPQQSYYTIHGRVPVWVGSIAGSSQHQLSMVSGLAWQSHQWVGNASSNLRCPRIPTQTSPEGGLFDVWPLWP